MKPTTSKIRTLFFHATFFFVTLCLLNVVSAEEVEIDSIRVDVYPSEIKPGDYFILWITFEEPNDNVNSEVLVTVEIGGVVVHNKSLDEDVTFDAGVDKQINISSREFEVKGRGYSDDVWNNNLLKYDCGDFDVNVEVSGEVNTESKSDELTIEPDDSDYYLYFTIDPEQPVIDDNIEITVTDDNDDEVNGAKVKFTYIDDHEEGRWEDDDDYEMAANTDKYGVTEFNIEDDFKESYGVYQIDVYMDGYCRADSKTIGVYEGELTVLGPEPASPKVGEQFKITVTDGNNPLRGARAWINELGVFKTGTSNNDGEIAFTIEQAGTFTLFVNASNYGQVEKRITVSSLNPLTITVSPMPAEVGKEVTIAVYSNGEAISEVSLTITKPGGAKVVKTTGGDGKATFTPDSIGIHSVTASKENYQDNTESFTANAGFTIQTPDAKSIIYGGELTVTVKDSVTQLPVASAVISGSGVPYGTKTDSMGQFTVQLGSSGQYNFMVSKNGYIDKGVSVTALCVLELRMNVTEAGIGHSVGIRVYDKEKNDYVTGNIAITKPDGTSETKVVEEYAFSPAAAGAYKIVLSKANCVGDEATLEVEMRSLSLESKLEGSKLTIRTVSGGKAVPDVAVNISPPSGLTESTVSDENGIIVINAVEDGNYTITSTDMRYLQKTVTVEKQPSFISRYWWAIIITIILMLIVILIVLVVVLFMRSRKKGDTSFSTVKKTSLG